MKGITKANARPNRSRLPANRPDLRKKMIRSCCPARHAHRVPRARRAKSSLRAIPLASAAAIRDRDSSAHFVVGDVTEAAIVAATIAAEIVVVIAVETEVLIVEETVVVIVEVATSRWPSWRTLPAPRPRWRRTTSK